MATTVIEQAVSADQATLDALRESVAGVLAEQSGSTAVHAFIDGKNSLDRDLWSQAASLGWLGFGIPEQHGGLGLGCQGLAILHTELGRQAAPGPLLRPSPPPWHWSITAPKRPVPHGCRASRRARSAPRSRPV